MANKNGMIKKNHQIPEDMLIRTRRSLLSRLRNPDNNRSWQEFHDIYGKLIFWFARKAGLTDSEADDAVQETMICVANKMPGFQYDPEIGSFRSWLLKTTQWRIADQFRRRKRDLVEISTPAEPGMTPLIERIEDPKDRTAQARWEEEWKKVIQEGALKRVKPKVNPKHYQIFELYVLKNLPAKTVAKTLGVTHNEIYVAKHRLMEMIRAEVEYLKDHVV